MGANFRTCIFGGFDRSDVIKYIEQSAREAQERIEALTQENAGLKEKNEQIEQALRTLHAQTKQQMQEKAEQEPLHRQLEAAQTELEKLRNDADTLRCESQTLQTENERLRAVECDYMSLKEHIADIEISAHRRTEEFRAQAIENLRQIIGQQRAWCQNQKGQYAFMNEKLLQEVRRATDILEHGDYSGFDAMLENLQNLEDSLA